MQAASRENSHKIGEKGLILRIYVFKSLMTSRVHNNKNISLPNILHSEDRGETDLLTFSTISH